MLEFLFYLTAYTFTIRKPPVIIEHAIITAYSSSVDETDDTPFITASGARVNEGIAANNCLKFGTIVEINGHKFTVQDRKNRRYSCEWFDIWKQDKAEAIQFGIIKNQQVKIYE